MTQPSIHDANVEVRGLSPDDLPSVVEIHTRAFPASAMTRLGRGTLLRYYDWQYNGPCDVRAIGAALDGRLVGFCFGGVFRSAIGGFVRRNRWYLAGQILMRPYLLVGPLSWERLRTGLKIVTSPEGLPAERPRAFRILVVAVDPAAQNNGIGAALMREAEAEAVARNFGQMCLGVHPANHKAVRFYEQLGWVKVKSSAGWTMGMRKDLSR